MNTVHENLQAGYRRRLAAPVQRPARSTRALWAVNFLLLLLVVVVCCASYAKHHPNEVLGRRGDEQLAMRAGAGSKRMWHASKEINAPLTPPSEDKGGILPEIPIKYLPIVVGCFMLAVPILTVSVLKGCWMAIDLLVPMQGAPQPNNYASRKHRDADLEAATEDAAAS